MRPEVKTFFFEKKTQDDKVQFKVTQGSFWSLRAVFDLTLLINKLLLCHHTESINYKLEVVLKYP